MIHSLRKKLGITQRELARKLFIQRNSVSRYETGIIKPSPQVLFILTGLARRCGERQLADALRDAGVELAAPSAAEGNGGAEGQARA
jgi:transcriptional regulator with XRE-family HTH domain